MSWFTRRTPPESVTDAPAEDRSLVSISDPGILTLLGGQPSLAGVTVTEQTALGLAAVWRCVSIIAGGIATLPLRTIRDQGTITERVPSWLDNPAGGLTKYELIETTLAHLLLHGNAFLAHVYNVAGALCGLAPIHPLAVGLDVDKTGTKTYTVTLADGSRRTFSDYTMTHIKGLSTDGIRGLSPLQVARNGAFGTALAADRSAAQLFGNGMLASAIAVVTEDMKEDDAAILQASIKKAVTGTPNAGQIAFINRNVTIHPWQLSNEDAQWLQAREYQKGEIATIFGVPDTLVGLGDKQSTWGTGIREMHQAMARWTFMPWTSRVEDRLSLLLPGRRAEFDYKGLLAPDPATEIDLLIKQVDAGLLSHDEARAILNRAPLPNAEQPQPVLE